MTWWHYLLLANVYLTLFFVFYTLFLRKETFFNLNRVYLVSAALLSFFIPVIQSDWIKNLFITQKVQETIYHVGPVVYQFTVTAATPQHQITLGQILGGIYVVGILVLTFRFIYQLAVINYVINQPQSDTTYSFFKQIKVEQRDTGNDVINAHEQVHARHWHSADILLLEAIMIINWFNPVVYLYRNAVKHIHEFIADRDALKTGTDKAEYAMLLLSQTFITPPYQLISPFFNHSLLKQRIMMLQKNKSQRIMLAKYGLSAPLFALMLVLSSATVNNSKAISDINSTARKVFSTPADFNNQNGRIPNGNGLSEADQQDLYTVIKQHQQTGANTVVPVKDNSTSPNTEAATTEPKEKIFTSVEQAASFPGGVTAFYQFLGATIRYPVEARENGLQGKVFVTFVVEKDGELSNLKVLRDIGGGLGEESLRVLKSSPKWIPGVQNGQPVRQQYTVPIAFTLVDGKDNSEASRNTAHIRNNNPSNTGTYTFAPVINLERPAADSIGSDFRISMTNKISPATVYATDSKNIDAVKVQKINTQGIQSVNTLKDKAASGLYGSKIANGMVQLITKHKKFFDQEGLSN
jgi:TonB family protein